jgi:hypothetical protein
MALVYDWLCFDRNGKDPNATRDGLYCIGEFLLRLFIYLS